MKNRKSLIIIFAVFLLGLLCWLHWQSRIKPPAPYPKSQPAAATQVPALNPITATSHPTPSISPDDTETYQPSSIPPIPANIYGMMSPDQQAEANDTQRALDEQNKTSINVYGKVVDQHGQPVPGVKVHGGVQLNMTMVSDRVENHDTETDSQGRFSFTGLHGIRFGLGLEKLGYEYNTQLYTTWWNSYKPDPANPMVFTLYKLQGAQPMVYAKFGNWIPYDGTSIKIDLFTGKKSDTGDFKVNLSRSPLQVIRGRTHFD
jgi:hypothetical protein